MARTSSCCICSCVITENWQIITTFKLLVAELSKTFLLHSTDELTPSPVMQRLGQWVRSLLVKFWIWLVAIMLFIFGIQGKEVVIFRIMYMVLFLIFTITFQVSSGQYCFLYCTAFNPTSII